MTRIAVFSDVHANLPALQATLAAIAREGVNLIVHTGDAISIGPYPAECVDLLLNTPNMQLIMGNHDSYFVDDLPQPQPAWMSDGEVAHQYWTHRQLAPQLRLIMAEWPYELTLDLDGVKTSFLHYALTPSGRDFVSMVRDPGPADLDLAFGQCQGQLIFYGHTHIASDVTGRARFVNTGSLGCAREAIASYVVVESHRGKFALSHRQVTYDDSALFRTFEKRRVPERRFLYQAFFGGRFDGKNGR